jgi:Proto-chlorophyllide reductase 57 kD subunit
MKFLCVPCDSPMKLQTVGPPDRGSLSIVYSCPECGYEIAMLTNAYETQAVQSLGVRIGPEKSLAPAVREADRPTVLFGRVASRPDTAEAGTSGAGCPFAAMIPGTEDAQRGQVAEPIPIRWTAAAEARLEKVPAFVRPMARTGIERFARENGYLEVDEKILEAAREFFGM